MSLKAKLEAVIYAAEEPVTLAQLAALFSEDVLAELAPAPSGGFEADTSSGMPGGEGAAFELRPEEPAPVQDSGEAAAGRLSRDQVSEEPKEAAPSGDPAPPSSPTGDRAEEQVVDRTGDREEDRADPPGDDLSAADQATAAQAAADQIAAEKQAARQRERRIREGLKQILDGLIEEYSTGDRGMEIREIAGGYRMATKPEYHDAVRGFVKSLKPPLKLSLPALETLAVVAYKQPVTAPEVSEIRGVDSSGVLGSLIARKLIATAGRKQVIGRPILYKTSREFLLRFGLKDLGDLPSMEEFEKMAGELAEGDDGGKDSGEDQGGGPKSDQGEAPLDGRTESQDAAQAGDASPSSEPSDEAVTEAGASESTEEEEAAGPIAVEEPPDDNAAEG